MDLEASFAEFWAAYPKRQGNPRKAAFEKYRVLVLRHKVEPATILKGTRGYAATRIGEDQRYTAHASTFLHQQRFNDFEDIPKNETVMLNGFYAADGTPQLAAWDAHWKATKGLNAPRDRKFGWRFPTEWPPAGNIVSLRKTA